MNIETERKFLVLDSTYKAQAVKSYTICQGYIAHDSGNTVRVRIRDNQGFLTIKGPSADGISRQEWEREIPLQDARELFLLCKPGTIEKTRWIVPAGTVPSGTSGRPCPDEWEGPAGEAGGRDEAKRRVPEGTVSAGRFFEVDEFHGENEGLAVAEIELGRSDEAFAKPDWLGQEVTGDKRYYNAQLSRHPFKAWKA